MCKAERYNPTEEEISELCAEIRRNWSESTERSRRVTKRVDWELPVIDSEHFELVFTDEIV